MRWFLMHRVELKVLIVLEGINGASKFLMHRVELKVIRFGVFRCFLMVVPNAPCGVERRSLSTLGR